MGDPKVGTSSQGKKMHYSVGALIQQDDKYLFIERVKPPPGFAGPAGHVDEGEDEVQALYREVREETGYTVINNDLVFEEEIPWNVCSRDVEVHHWYLFRCEVEGKLERSLRETKSADWYTVDQLKELQLEEAWGYMLKKLEII